jgi:predicted alpha/beta-hydrolase family hydrolase
VVLAVAVSAVVEVDVAGAVEDAFCGPLPSVDVVICAGAGAAIAFEIADFISASLGVRNPRQSGHRFRRKAATRSDRKRPANPNEGGHPVDGVIRGTLSAV